MKNKSKRIIAAVTALSLAGGIVITNGSVSVSETDYVHAEQIETEKYTYEKSYDGSFASITKWNDDSAETVVIPDTVGSLAFFGDKKLAKAVMGNGISKIGSRIFNEDITTMYVYNNSASHKYAEKNGYKYEIIDETSGPVTTPTVVPTETPTAVPTKVPYTPPVGDPTDTPSKVPSTPDGPGQMTPDSPVPSAEPTKTPDAPVSCDLNGDGKTTTTDVKHILKRIVGKIKFSEEQEKAADINGDGAVNTSDALHLLRAIAQISE